MAVRGQLTTARPANWEKHGLPAYTPDTLFPVPALVGGGHIPVQVVEGILAQESNFSQATTHAIPGVAGDPLIANYYGAVYNSSGQITGVSSSSIDCGYGLGQLTSHMTTADTTWSPTLKREVATDYEVNIAATVQLLAQLWNQLNSSPENIIMNDGNPSEVENWYAVAWAYNTGIQPWASYGNTSGCTPGPTCTYNGNWGLGWTNNPAQNAYPPNRAPFLSDGYQDAATPGNWPYQERVMGWAQYPQQDFVNGGYKYVGTAAPLTLTTNYYNFCTSANNCSQSSASTGYCLSSDRTTCWAHFPVMWVPNGAGQPENASRYVAGSTEPSVADPYPAACSASAAPVVQTPNLTSLPSGAVIVDTQPDSSANLAGCATAASSGSFSFNYGTDSSGNPTGAIDVHQLGVGYMGHSYFGHTVDPSRTLVQATGTWTPPASVLGWQRIWVFLPDNGAITAQANYIINTGTTTFHRVVNQHFSKNVWFDLGSFQLSAGASVSLSNSTYSDFNDGAIDISWSALAFTPSTKPVVDYVAMGDSYQSGEGLQPYYQNSDNGDGTGYVNGCHRSPQAYPNLVFNDLSTLHLGEAEFHFVACSGAVTTDVDSSVGSGSNVDYHEVPQLSTGFIDTNTTTVTIGIGGNDARFSAILLGCFLTVTDCTAPNYYLTVNGQKDPAPLTTYEPQVINGLLSPLEQLYRDVENAAPLAQIIVVGYPHVIVTDSTQNRGGIPCGQYSQADINFFAQEDDLLNSVASQAASAVDVTFVDTRQIFEGPPEHEACAATTDVEWINAAIAYSSSGDGFQKPGAGSFHPKVTGHQADERAIDLYLR